MAFNKITLVKRMDKDEKVGPQERRVMECIEKACKKVGNSASRDEVLEVITESHNKDPMTEKMTPAKLLSYYQSYLARSGHIKLEVVETDKQRERREKKEAKAKEASKKGASKKAA
ncbi:MAG: hypothetical protein R3330_01625 [Saprospiraceae bacterium]|nr:hypothetical protein [Saprospiraceae bacterium]